MNTLDAITKLKHLPPEVIEAGLQLLPSLNRRRIYAFDRVGLRCMDCGESHIVMFTSIYDIRDAVERYSVCVCGSRRVVQI